MKWYGRFGTEHVGHSANELSCKPIKVLQRPIAGGADVRWRAFLVWTPMEGYLVEVEQERTGIDRQHYPAEYLPVIKTNLDDETRKRMIRQVRDRLNKATRLVDILKTQEALTNV